MTIKRKKKKKRLTMIKLLFINGIILAFNVVAIGAWSILITLGGLA